MTPNYATRLSGVQCRIDCADYATPPRKALSLASAAPPQAFSQYSTAMASDLPPVVRVALLTPSGRGALAVVGVRGLGVGDLIAQRFTPRSRKPLAEWPDGGVIFGRWGDPEHGEELVVVRLTDWKFIAMAGWRRVRR